MGRKMFNDRGKRREEQGGLAAALGRTEERSAFHAVPFINE